MPAEITMPQQSDTMTEGTVVKWLKKEGDKVKAGEIIAEIETDKAVMEQESFEAGTLALIITKPGEKAKVGAVMGVLAVGSEKLEDVKKQYAGGGTAASAPAVAGAHEKAAKAEPVAATAGAPKAAAGAPAKASRPHDIQEGDARAVKQQHEPLHANARDAIAEPVGAATANGNGSDRLRASPLARRIAADRQVDLATVKGTGPGGRIVQSDVLNAPKRGAAVSAGNGAPVAQAAPLPQRVARGQKEVVSFNKMRQTIALRLQQSKQNLPHFYETVDVEMNAIATLRERLNKQFEKQGIRLSVSDLINKAIAAALVQHPNLNGHYDATKTEFTRFGDVNLGIAVALPDGLIVPVLRNIDQMGVREIRERSVDIAARARGGKLKGDEMTGATFTVSTLGQWGIRQFNAIINPPEVGILAVGAVEPRAVVRDGQVVARQMMTITVSVDHRVVDGATAADFLRTLKGMLEEPGMMLA